jgi:hypothetical protein
MSRRWIAPAASLDRVDPRFPAASAPPSTSTLRDGRISPMLWYHVVWQHWVVRDRWRRSNLPGDEATVVFWMLLSRTFSILLSFYIYKVHLQLSPLKTITLQLGPTTLSWFDLPANYSEFVSPSSDGLMCLITWVHIWREARKWSKFVMLPDVLGFLSFFWLKNLWDWL